MLSKIGSIIGIVNGNGIAIFNTAQEVTSAKSSGIFEGVCAFIFAYEGWIAVTTINSELKNPKRDLPLALIVGTILCTILYIINFWFVRHSHLPVTRYIEDRWHKK